MLDIQQVFSKKFENDYPNKTYDYAIFGIFRPSNLRPKEPNATNDISEYFHKY